MVDTLAVYNCPSCKHVHTINEKHCIDCGQLHTNRSGICDSCLDYEFDDTEWEDIENPNEADVYGEGS